MELKTQPQNNHARYENTSEDKNDLRKRIQKLDKLEEEALRMKRGKRRTYSFTYHLHPEYLSLDDLKRQFKEESIPSKNNQKRKLPLANYLDGVFISESLKKAFIFFKDGKEPTFFKKYRFVKKDSIQRWNAKSHNFDPSYPPNAADICWDFRLEPENAAGDFRGKGGCDMENEEEDSSSLQSPKSIQSSKQRESSEEDRNHSKLKIKQHRKLKEKSRRNFPASDNDADDEDEHFILDFYGRIKEGQSFHSIFKEFLETDTELKTLRRLNRISSELLAFEKNIYDSKRLAPANLLGEPIYMPNHLEFENYKSNYSGWKNRLYAISDKAVQKKNSQDFWDLIGKGWNPVAFIDLIENKKCSLKDIKDEIARRNDLPEGEIHQLFGLLENYLKTIEHVENSRKNPSFT